MPTPKFVDLIHYVIWRANDPSRLGATKLNKVAWLVDSLTYLYEGQSLTGATYTKRQHGPVPKHILGAIERLVCEGRIAVTELRGAFQPREFAPLKTPDKSVFSERDTSLIDAVIDWVCDQHTATSISKYTHDAIWEAAEIGEEIPLYAILGASEGQVNEADQAWANGIIGELTISGAGAAIAG